MLIWLQKAEGMVNTKSLLVCDQFRAHLVDKVRQRTNKGHNTNIAVIPGGGGGGLTSILQPLDVSVNHPFKCKLSEQWSAWMMSDAVEHTAAGNRKRPLLPIVMQWVKTTWDSIDPAIIVNAFTKCLITNELDGTEDDILWQDNRDAPCADSDIEGEEMYDDMLATDQMIQMLEEDDSDEEFLGFD